MQGNTLPLIIFTSPIVLTLYIDIYHLYLFQYLLQDRVLGILRE